MKKTILLGGAAAAAFLLASAPGAEASLFLDTFGVSYDNWAPNSFAPNNINYVVEDWKVGDNQTGWLDPGYGGDAYDAEAAYMAVDGQFLYVAVVTGFPLSGRASGNDYFHAGDIGLDLNADGNYEYAVDVDGNGALRSGNLNWENPAIGGGQAWNGVSDPLRVTSWNNSATTQFSYASWQGRYAIEAIIDLGDMNGGSSTYDMHWTMGCGNDEIEMRAVADPVPEPATMLLLGGGLGLAGIVRRRRQSNGEALEA